MKEVTAWVITMHEKYYFRSHWIPLPRRYALWYSWILLLKYGQKMNSFIRCSMQSHQQGNPDGRYSARWMRRPGNASIWKTRNGWTRGNANNWNDHLWCGRSEERTYANPIFTECHMAFARIWKHNLPDLVGRFFQSRKLTWKREMKWWWYSSNIPARKYEEG